MGQGRMEGSLESVARSRRAKDHANYVVGDGSKEWTPEWLEKLGHRFGDDGDFWIAYEDLLRKYQAFERTRLFGEEWSVTQIWTTLNVPWMVNYHDTYFSLSISKPGPVVLVLSQLDDRYFRGLEGQYRFELGFRLHKTGHEDYIVRSQTPYRMRRSVNVELDLEAGDYDVRIKIDATRYEDLLPIERVVRDNAKDCREKLTRIGLAYDLAHGKGKVLETPEEKASRKAHEKKQKEKVRQKIKKDIQKSREEQHYLKKKQYERDVERQKKAQKQRKAKMAEMNAKRRDAGMDPRAGPPNVMPRQGMNGRGRGRRGGWSPGPFVNETSAEPTPDGTVTPANEETKQALPPADDAAKSAKEVQPVEAPKQEATNPPPQPAHEPHLVQEPMQEAPHQQHQPVQAPHLGQGPTQEALHPQHQPGPTQEAPHPQHQPAYGPRLAQGPTQDASRLRQQLVHRPQLAQGPRQNVPPQRTAARRINEPRSVSRPNEGMVRDGRARQLAPPRMDSECEFYEGPFDEEDCESESDPCFDDFDSLSELSERELDLQVDNIRRMENSRPPPPPREGQPPEEEPDEFERDPWNAVAVVGLRVYHKSESTLSSSEVPVEAGDDTPAQGESTDVQAKDTPAQEDIVKLKVVRPNPYATRDEIDEEEKKSKELDVDDSAKDATLVGGVTDRKKSIMGNNRKSS